MKTRYAVAAASLFVALGFATSASAQILDGEYWKATLSGKTRIIEPGASVDDEGETDPELLFLTKGKLKKTTAYLRTLWNEGEQFYDLDVWNFVGGDWVQTENAGMLLPFGEGFPNSSSAGFEVTVDLGAPPAPTEGLVNMLIDVDGLVNLKIKEDKKNPIPDNNETQMLDVGGATGGTYQLSFNGQSTNPITFDSDAESIRTHLSSLPTIGADNVSVGAIGPDFAITFTGDLGMQDVSQILVAEDDTTGGTGVLTATTNQGMPPTPVLKGGSFKLDSVGATMEGEDFGAKDADLFGSPKFSSKRVTTDQLPFKE